MKTKAEYERERRKRFRDAGYVSLGDTYVPKEKAPQIKRDLRKKYPPPKAGDNK